MPELFPPDFAGGGEYVAGQIALSLHRRGHGVTVLTTGDPNVTHYEGIQTVRLPGSRFRLSFAKDRLMQMAANVDIIHAFTYHGLYPSTQVGRALGKPVVCGVLALFGDVWQQMHGPLGGRLRQFYERLVLRQHFAAKLHLSGFSQALAKDIGVDCPGDQVVVPGISQGQYRQSDKRSYILFTAKLDLRKGYGLVLEAARRLPDIPFRIITWGDDFDKVAALAPANVLMERRSDDRNQYLDALAGARVFLFPTKVETFGLVLPEAMASGCSIISTSPLPFEGVRVGQDDADGVCAAVRSLWDNPALCAWHGEANRQIAAQYDWHRHVATLEEIYGRLLDAPKH